MSDNCKICLIISTSIILSHSFNTEIINSPSISNALSGTTLFFACSSNTLIQAFLPIESLIRVLNC